MRLNKASRLAPREVLAPPTALVQSLFLTVHCSDHHRKILRDHLHHFTEFPYSGYVVIYSRHQSSIPITKSGSKHSANSLRSLEGNSAKMSYNKEKDGFGEGPKTHKIRITLTSRKVASLFVPSVLCCSYSFLADPRDSEKVCQELIERAKSSMIFSNILCR
jgi:hypothetical protein